MRGSRTAKRVGFTLIEVVTVLTTLIALGGTSLAILRTLDVTRRVSMTKAIAARDVQRLADRLRELAHAGATAEVKSAGRSLVLADTDYRHTFTIDSGGEAIEYVAEAAADGAAAGRDQFVLSRPSDAEFRFDDSIGIVSLGLKPRRGSSPTWTIEARILDQASP